MKGTLPLQGVGGRSTEEVALNVGEFFPWEQARKDVLSCGYNTGKGSGAEAGGVGQEWCGKVCQPQAARHGQETLAAVAGL